MKAAAIGIAVILTLAVLAGGTAYASQRSLPGDNLYPLKLGTEQIRLWFTYDNFSRAEMEMEFASLRLKEVNALAVKTQDKIDMAVTTYQKNLNAAVDNALKIEDPTASARILEELAGDIAQQLAICNATEDTVSGPVRENIREASQIAIRAEAEVLIRLAAQSPLRATQLNLAAMQSQLQRARIKAEAGEFVAMESALRDYEQLGHLGEQVLDYARSSGYPGSEIEDLTYQAFSTDVNTLQTMSEQVPLELKVNVDAAKQFVIELQKRAQSQQPIPGSSSQTPAISNPVENPVQGPGGPLNVPPATPTGSAAKSGIDTPAPSSTQVPFGPPTSTVIPGESPGTGGNTGTTSGQSGGSSPGTGSGSGSSGGSGGTGGSGRR